MKILAVADEESRLYYDYYQPGLLDDIDLILACGDLNKSYLEFLVTMAHCPVLYVCGNHDDSFEKDPPEGCICIENQIYIYKGIRIMGLGGSYRYKRNGTYMYTENQMRWRLMKMRFPLWLHKGVDICVTHAPAYHINDLNSLSHRGFQCFVDLIKEFKPKYFIHGHIHKSYGVKIPRVTQFEDTTIINAFEHYKFEY